MTTTELYSGYASEGKPSSRVLRPPGGGSSNIFGGADPTPQEQVRREQQQQPVAPQGQQGAASNPTVDAQQEYQRNKPKQKVNYNPITGEEYPADYGKNEEDEEKNNDEESQEENTETTEENTEQSTTTTPKAEEPAPTPAPAAPFQKVRQPPGGRSSGPLW